ncbi:MAG: hypothetical protein WCF85_15135 [Rhodospirillaceae bacterium]
MGDISFFFPSFLFFLSRHSRFFLVIPAFAGVTKDEGGGDEKEEGGGNEKGEGGSGERKRG